MDNTIWEGTLLEGGAERLRAGVEGTLAYASEDRDYPNYLELVV